MFYKEYNYLDEGEKVGDEKFLGKHLSKENYIIAHSNLPILCHDIFIDFNGKILLVKRDNKPAKGFYWPIGGRVRRGLAVEESLKIKVKEECNLEIEDIMPIGLARTIFSEEPFGHGKGTDTYNIIFYAKGRGAPKLDSLHEEFILIDKDELDSEKLKLDSYCIDFINKIFHQKW
jgi:ADP-ribose pyrophosphatase YjhB (NUDIX family)